MTMRLLWFVLAGFLLGFAASTLWEWLHFRRERRRFQAARIEELEAQLVAEQEANAQLRMIIRELDHDPRAAYSSSGVFLDSETATGPAPGGRELVRETDASAARPAVSAEHGRHVGYSALDNGQPSFAGEAAEDADPVFEEESASVFEMVFDDDPNLIGQLAAELSRQSTSRAAGADHNKAAAAPTVTTRSTDVPDNLSMIEGVGTVHKFRLYDAGLFTWRQVAESDVETLRLATHAADDVNVDQWPALARELANKNGRQSSTYSGPVPDDLTRIAGIIPEDEQVLYNAGICTYAQLSRTSVSGLMELFPLADGVDTPDFQQWIEQAHEQSQRRTA